MTKKFFLTLLIAFVFLLFSSISVFAENNPIQDVGNSIDSEVKNSWDKVGNSIEEAGNKINNGMNHMKNENNNNDNNNDNNHQNSGFMGMTDNNNNNNNNYTAIKTSADGQTLMGMNSTMWTWLVFAILAVFIVALVWYYGMQQSNNSNHSDNND